MPSFSELYGSSPELRSRAPGRIEIIGNHVDYNGGTVLGASIDRAITLEFRARPDRRLRLASALNTRPVEAHLDSLTPLAGSSSWANYPLGVIHILEKEGLSLPHGFDLLVSSDLPSGAGVSSSAALEMATAVLLNQAYNGSFDTLALVRAARRAENEFVGVPCGILDQGVVGFGEADGLVCIDCATESFRTIPLPKDTCFWIFNTNKKHSLVDSFYATRYKECMEATAHFARFIPGLRHLAQVPASALATHGASLPEPLQRRARHVIEEQERVNQLINALASGEDWSRMGHLLTASHASSRDFFDNSCEELDFLVDLLTPIPTVYGARLTGGGFGGAVLAVTSPAFSLTEAQPVVTNYERKFQLSPTVLPLHPGPGAQVL